MKISVIIPTYKAASKLSGCFDSLEELNLALGDEMEVLFVDDHSGDGTVGVLEGFCRRNPFARFEVLPENSGSPSTPRNRGIENARGDYVFFLDADDSLLVPGILQQLDCLEEENSDVVRSTLLRNNGHSVVTMNQVYNWNSGDQKPLKIAKIIRSQSTTPPGLIRRSLLIENNIRWDASLRMGEDTVFLAQTLAAATNISFTEEPVYVYNTSRTEGNLSSTQQYSDRELLNHVKVWQASQNTLMQVGVDYFHERGKVALRAVLDSMIKNNIGGFSAASFEAFSSFVTSNWETISKFDFGKRGMEVLQHVRAKDIGSFNHSVKARLLVAGYDLKFIKSLLPHLNKYYSVQVDEWTGHETHDLQRSKRMLEWAEIIHCEWLLGNAVWYSKNKRADQKLVIRAHRFEVTRDYGFDLAIENVDRIIFVAMPILEQMVKKFGLPRTKVRLIPNFLDTGAYETSTDDDKVFNLAMVGYLPSLKGLHRALEVLAKLRQFDDRYNLTLYGKSPEELSWVSSDPEQAKYYSECWEFIFANNLECAVKKAGWADLTQELQDKGFVLSMSDLESFHIAPAEAFCAGNVGLFRPWNGVEYIYPSKYILGDVDAFVETIIELNSAGKLEEFARDGKSFIEDNYDVEKISQDYTSMIQSID